MAIAIVVEDGSGKPDANSYNSVADLRAYAEMRGVTLPDTDDAVAVLLIRATDYLETKRYRGERATETQALAWPRTDVEVDGVAVPSDGIPKNLKLAQCALALASNDGVNLLPNYSAGDFVTREKVGQIETDYADPVVVGMSPKLTGVDALLRPLLSFNGCFVRTLRV